MKHLVSYKMLICLVVQFFTLATIICCTQAAAVDCHVKLDVQATQHCCSMPKVKLDAFSEPCGKYLSSITRSPTPCYFECVNNVSKVYDGDNFNLENTRNLLNNLLDGNKEFVELYALGYQNCSGQDGLFQNERPIPTPIGMRKCSPVPYLQGFCAHKYAYINCPATSWTDSEICKEHREYMINCRKDNVTRRMTHRAHLLL